MEHFFDPTRHGRIRAGVKRLATLLVFLVLLAATRSVWIPSGIAFTAETEAEKHFSARIYYTEREGEAFSEERAVSVFVDKGRFRVWRLIPVRRIKRLRFDFGEAPGSVRVSRIKVLGRTRAKLNAGDFVFSPDVEERTAEKDGTLAIRSEKPDPHMVCRHPLDMEGTVRLGNVWQTSPLVVLWALVLFVFSRFVVRMAAGAWVLFRQSAKSPDVRNASGRIVAFDFIRIAAFLLIVLAHVLEWGDSSGVPGWATLDSVHWGRLGVAIFFILSGASLSVGSLRNGTGFLPFYRKRLRAILPPFWFAYFVCAMVAFGRSRAMAMGSDWISVPPTLFGMDGYLNTRLPTCYRNVGEWFVGCLLLVYLCAPAIHRAVKNRPVFTLIGLYALGVAALRYSVRLSDAVPIFNKISHFNVLPHLFGFAFGMTFFLHVRPFFRRYAAAAAAAAVLIVAYVASAPRPLFVCDPFGIPASAALFTVVCFIFDHVPCSAPCSETAGLIGKASYLAFLFHHRAIFRFLRSGEPLDGARTVYAVLLVASSTLLLAVLCQKPVAALTDIVFGKRPAKAASR